MSDSELSELANAPGDDEIEQCLKRITRKLSKSGDVTVNGARKATEAELGLEADFLKGQDWKDRSKAIISAAVDDDGPSSPEVKTKATAKKSAAKAGTKRKSDEAPSQKRKPAKKAKKETSDSEASELGVESDEDHDDDFEESDAAPAKKKAPARRKVSKKSASDNEDDHDPDMKPKAKARAKKKLARKAVDDVVESEESNIESTEAPQKAALEEDDTAERSNARAVSKDESELSDPPKSEADEEAPKPIGKPSAPDDGDESDMSVLLDEPPKKQRQKKDAAESKAKAKAKKAAKPKAGAKEVSPDDEEIKRLQGWLLKCGIRRVWGKELKPYDTSKAKIKHLKSMLEDAGMTGRYSAEKAKQIKEARELKDELDAVKEYDEKWGQEKEGSGDEGSRGEQVSEEEVKPVVRRPKGLVDFGDSGDDSD